MMKTKIKNKKKNDENKKETMIAKVWEFSYSGQKCITIPRKSDVKTGDYVVIKKLNLPNEELLKIKREE